VYYIGIGGLVFFLVFLLNADLIVKHMKRRKAKKTMHRIYHKKVSE